MSNPPLPRAVEALPQDIYGALADYVGEKDPARVAARLNHLRSRILAFRDSAILALVPPGGEQSGGFQGYERERAVFEAWPLTQLLERTRVSDLWQGWYERALLAAPPPATSPPAASLAAPEPSDAKDDARNAALEEAARVCDLTEIDSRYSGHHRDGAAIALGQAVTAIRWLARAAGTNETKAKGGGA